MYICILRHEISTVLTPERHVPCSCHPTVISRLDQRRKGDRFVLPLFHLRFHSAVKFLFEECYVPSEV